MPPKIILKISIIVFCTSASFFFIRNVSAQSPTQVFKKITNAPITNYKAQTTNPSEVVTCEALTKRFTTRMERFTTATEKTDENYKTLKTKLYTKMTELKEKGANVAKIEAAFSQVDRKIREIENKRVKLHDLTKNLQGQWCKSSKTSFSKSLEETNNAAKALHKDSIELQKLFQSEIRAEM